MTNRIDAWSRGYAMRKILGVKEPELKDPPTYQELLKTEWSNDFDDVCKPLMIMGAFRYGRMNGPNKKQFDRISDAIRRLELYQENHNMLHLADARNLIMLEFEEGIHPDRHFKNEDDIIHSEEKQ